MARMVEGDDGGLLDVGLRELWRSDVASIGRWAMEVFCFDGGIDACAPFGDARRVIWKARGAKT